MKIKDVNTISTKKGDSGTSKNYSNQTFTKDDILFETLGSMDELSSILGLTFHHSNYEKIKTYQTTLQAINALIATDRNANEERYDKLRQINEKDIEALEAEGQRHLDQNPLEPRFVLPGSEASPSGAYFDLSRAVCRRAERTLVRYVNHTQRQDLVYAQKFLNRLSDLLFILARSF